MIKRYYYFIFLIFSFFLNPFSSSAQWDDTDSLSYPLIIKGLYQLNTNEFQEAHHTFKDLITIQPHRPIGYMGKARVYDTIMRNYRINSYEDQLDSLMDLTIDIGEKAIRKNPKDVMNLLYLGGAYGYRGLYKVRKRDWFGALEDGLKGLINLQKTLALQPDFYDAYYGLGLYHYWRAAKMKIIGFIPFLNLNKEREKGIKELHLAVEKGKYSMLEGKFALVAVYYDNEDYQNALKVHEDLYRICPENPSCLYMRSRIFEKLKNWEISKQTYQTLLNHISTSPYQSIGFQIECHYGIALCSYNLQDYKNAQIHIQTALKLINIRDETKELEGPLEDFAEIEGNIKRLHNDLQKFIVR